MHEVRMIAKHILRQVTQQEYIFPKSIMRLPSIIEKLSYDLGILDHSLILCYLANIVYECQRTPDLGRSSNCAAGWTSLRSSNNFNMNDRTFTGLAMRMCIELGLHRQKRSLKVSLRSELNKRLFWSCYWMDREIAIALGRPPTISDHDIDVEVRDLCPY